MPSAVFNLGLWENYELISFSLDKVCLFCFLLCLQQVMQGFVSDLVRIKCGVLFEHAFAKSVFV